MRRYLEHRLSEEGRTYVVSDIHGDYSKFLKMLKEINFSDKDTLYICGDIFDRGKQPYNIFAYIVKYRNIHLLRGNHEDFIIDFYETGIESDWLYNGGYKSYVGFIEKNPMQRDFIYNYLKMLPICIVINDEFILSHAGLYIPPLGDDYTIDQLINFMGNSILSHRKTLGNEKKYKHYTQICGHNKVQSILREKEKAIKILKREGAIYIDCGSGFKYKNSKLACLCLNDMKEYYV